MITEEEINEAYDLMIELMQRHYEATEQLADCKYNLETTKAKVLADGLITGKNAEIREANFRMMHSDLFDNLEDRRSDYQDKKLLLDQTKANVDRIKLIIRLKELEK